MSKITRDDLINLIMNGVEINRYSQQQASEMIHDIDSNLYYLSNINIINAAYNFKVSQTKLGKIFYGELSAF